MSRVLPHLNRLADALAGHGVKLKRADLLEVAAAAFGFRNSNELTAAARDGELDPAPAVTLGRITIAGKDMIVLSDPATRETFAASAEEGDILLAPHGGMVRVAELKDSLRPLNEAFSSIPSSSSSTLWIARVEPVSKQGHVILHGSSRAIVTAKLANWCQNQDADLENFVETAEFDEDKNQDVVDAFFAKNEGRYFEIENVSETETTTSGQTQNAHDVIITEALRKAKMIGNWPLLEKMLKDACEPCMGENPVFDILAQLEGLNDDLREIVNALTEQFTSDFSIDLGEQLASKKPRSSNLREHDAAQTLRDERHEAANAEFEDFVFLRASENAPDVSYMVQADGGWEYETPGTAMSRPVFLGEEGAEETIKVTFTVTFDSATSYKVVEAYAITENGYIFGTRAGRDATS